jgi:branched-chain amino acid transport system substrate-binding protein
LLAKVIRELNIPALLCGGGGGFTLPQFIKRAGKGAERLLTASLWSPNLPYPGSGAYYSQYLKRYGLPPDYHGAEAYSALLVAADALNRAESLDPNSIRRALASTFMLTPFGPVKFYTYNDFERQNSTRTQVLQIIDGKFEMIWPPEFATKEFSRPSP